MTVGERIRSCRERQGISQTALADAIGTAKQNVYKYETGIITNIPSDKIEMIAAALHTTPAFLMGWDSSGDKEPAAPENGDGRPYEEVQLLRWFSSLPPEKRQAILALGDAPEELRAYLERERSGKSK